MNKIVGIYATAEGSVDVVQEIAETAQDPSKLKEYAGIIWELYGQKTIDFLIKVMLIILIYCIAVKIIKHLCKILRTYMEKLKVSPAAVSFVTSLMKVGLYLLLILNLAISLGVKESSVAALLASSGVAISLALQGGLSNFAGGVIILMLRPFSVGDYIIETSAGMEGTVKSIEMYYTKLATMDNREIVIPNSKLTGSAIVNVTSQDRRKLEIKVGISYNSDMKLAKSIMEHLAEEDVRIENEERVCFVDSLGDSAVTIGLRGWVKTSEYWSVKWAMNEKIKNAFDQAGIEIPYNQLDVHIRNAEQQTKS